MSGDLSNLSDHYCHRYMKYVPDKPSVIFSWMESNFFGACKASMIEFNADTPMTDVPLLTGSYKAGVLGHVLHINAIFHY